MIDMAEISTNLVLQESGIWAANQPGHVSYPTSGNAVCFDIEERSFWYAHRNACIAEVVKRYPPEEPFFDIGGGNGIVGAFLQGLGIDVCLVEPGMDGAMNASRRGIACVVCSTFEAAGFREDTIPSAGMFDVLEHVEDDHACLEAIHKALIPGGKLFITVPACPRLWSANDEHLGHFRRYRLGALTEMLAGKGFSVECATHLFAPLPVPVFLCRTLPTLLRINRAEVTPDIKRREHLVGRRWLKRFLERVQRVERRRIGDGRSVRWGTTCLVVAVKTSAGR